MSDVSDVQTEFENIKALEIQEREMAVPILQQIVECKQGNLVKILHLVKRN